MVPTGSCSWFCCFGSADAVVIPPNQRDIPNSDPDRKATRVARRKFEEIPVYKVKTGT